MDRSTRRAGLGSKVLNFVVVVVIVFLLAAILFPVFFRAREKARAPHMGMKAPVPSAEAPTAPLTVTGESPGSADGGALPPVLANRKLVRTASLTLQVPNTEEALKTLDQLAVSLGGFTGDTSVSRHGDGSQSASVTLRVPVARFAEALQKVRALGQVEHVQTTVQDVTDEYVDLDARLRNARREETEILKLLDRGGKLADIIQIETKLAEVRGRIEQMQGQMRQMTQQIDLSTLTLNVHEKGEAAVMALSQYNVRYHLLTAWRSMVRLLEGLLTAAIYVVIVGWVIWLPAVLLVLRGRRRRRAAEAAGAERVPPAAETADERQDS
jgi:large-conductance mechanosensitive channel